MEDQPDKSRSLTVADDHLPTRFRLLGVLPLIFFLTHALYYVRHGGLSHLLWMCNIGNLVLSVGLFFGRPALIRLAVFWLIPGLPLWLWYVVMRGGWLLTSSFAHVGGLIVGLIALARVRVSRWSWLSATAWYLLVQQVCRMFTPAALNVNLAHQIYGGWENVFSSYWQYWLATTAAVGVGMWLMGIILVKLLPPRTASP